MCFLEEIKMKQNLMRLLARNRGRGQFEIKAAADRGEDVVAVAKKYEQEYETTLVNPYMAAERGFVDAVIPPSETRGQIIEGLRLLDRKVVNMPAKKHGNIPL